jgi:gluconolactonase
VSDVRIFADGLGFPEAPVLLPDGGLLIVEMDPARGWVTRFDAAGRSRRTIVTTGRPNGLAPDRDGRIWVAETRQRALLRLRLDGSYETMAADCRGEPFLFPNDVALAPNGDVYFTDSGVDLDAITPGGELNPDYRDLRYDGRVYRFDPNRREIACIDRGFLFTNGIAFGPDGHLYVAETLSGAIYRYRCKDGAVVGGRETFGNAIERFDPAELKGPDGMKFGADGNLYVCVFGQGDVTVLGRDGAVVRRIRTRGAMPTNLCFGRRGERIIYVTEVESGSVQIHDVDTDGFPLYL